MNKSEAENLLNSVSWSLFAGYELKNLEGRTLRDIYEEYIDAVAKRKKMSFLLYCSVVIGFILVCAVLVSCSIYFPEQTVLEGVATILGGTALIYFITFFPHLKLWKYSYIIGKCEGVFNEFKYSVEALNPQGIMTSRVYTEASTYNTLAMSADRLLTAEKKFKERRLIESELIDSILDAGHEELRCRNELEKLLKAAEKFGLLFNKSELFREAEAINDGR